MHKQAIKHKQAIIGGGYLFTENACWFVIDSVARFSTYTKKAKYSVTKDSTLYFLCENKEKTRENMWTSLHLNA